MSKRKSNLYVKYFIKSPMLFYVFLLVGVMLFLYLSLSLQLDVVEHATANISGDTVIVAGEWELTSNAIHLYTDRNDIVHRLNVTNVTFSGGNTLFSVDNPNNLYGEFEVDIAVGTQTLFHRIFVRAGRG